MTELKDMQVNITPNNQEDAGDENFYQTCYYSEETCNYPVYLFKTDDIQKLRNYLLAPSLRKS
jgi:hypothetical protein